jgi:hypothetical protein
MHFQHWRSLVDEFAGFLSQYIVYSQAYQFEPPGFDYLPKLKVGKFSQSPKTWFPNVKFLSFQYLTLIAAIHRASFNSTGKVGIDKYDPLSLGDGPFLISIKHEQKAQLVMGIHVGLIRDRDPKFQIMNVTDAL